MGVKKGVGFKGEDFRVLEFFFLVWDSLVIIISFQDEDGLEELL